jgi:hypothetical protein
MDTAKIIEYLIDDLKKSVENDIKPCLNPATKEGGYFAVPRLVLSYVDYLGVLYHGYDGRKDGSNRRILSQGVYAKEFLKDIFGYIDSNYKLYGELLWEIYRNGTIHLYSPKVLKDKNSDKTIGWLTHKGPRVAVLGDDESVVIHLVPHSLGKSLWEQPISIICLYGDLVSAIERFADLIPKYPLLEQKFTQSANALVEPEETTNLTW